MVVDQSRNSTGRLQQCSIGPPQAKGRQHGDGDGDGDGNEAP